MSWHDSLLWATLTAVLLVRSADASSLTPPDARTLTPIVEASPTLAPFQHVRFCLRYPADCRSSPDHAIRIELNTQTMELLDRVNRDVNLSIIPKVKSYGSDLEDSWNIAPDMGDCNDYAVTKRHNLLGEGLPASALRLSVLKTASGIGHLVLIVATTNGDVVMDNLTAAIRPWQTTDYQWLKIQSASDPRFWSEVRSPGIGLASQANRKVRVAGRLAN